MKHSVYAAGGMTISLGTGTMVLPSAMRTMTPSKPVCLSEARYQIRIP